MTRQHFWNGSATALVVIGVLWMLTHATSAQTPAAAAGTKSEAAASTPKMPDGKPDLNGTWDNGRSTFGFAANAGNVTTCVFGCQPFGQGGGAAAGPRPGPDRPVYKPEFVSKVKMLDDQQVKLDPALYCKPPGLPRIGPPDKIVQTPGQIVFLYDDLSGAFFRIVPTDGRRHRADVDPTYLGDSVGHWEGDTLVIEATNFNDDSWLGDNGLFHTTNLKVTERLRRTGNTIAYTVTVEDPAVLAAPWVMRPRTLSLTDQDLIEPAPCVEKSLEHVVDGTHHDNAR
jgi:hypothetical protein